METPKVSVFITTYNWPEALQLCLQSVARQTHIPNEVIIADDGSGEETKTLIEAFQKDFPCPLIHVWQEDDGYRINTIRNKAIAKASYPYIIQLDGDIICDPNFVKDHLAFAKPNRFIAGRRTNLSELASKEFCAEGDYSALNPFRNKVAAIMHQMALYDNKSVRGVRGCNLAYWKDDAYKVNGFEEKMSGKGPDDKEFAIRLVHAGIKVYNLKFYAIANHLYHGEEGLMNNYSFNQKLYMQTIKDKNTMASKGLNN